MLERAYSSPEGWSQLTGSVHDPKVPTYQLPPPEQLLYVTLSMNIHYFIESL